ncbi:hypothetical protein, partial [Nocardia farcinica]|uniref:hypothetical protein n=1 Tax=Nocardia farcinica TaxID=37329 RepID=UPI002456A4FC
MTVTAHTRVRAAVAAGLCACAAGLAVATAPAPAGGVTRQYTFGHHNGGDDTDNSTRGNAAKQAIV